MYIVDVYTVYMCICRIIFFFFQLRREFKAIVGVNDSVYALLDNWPTWQQRIAQYAKVEGKNRPVCRTLLDSVDFFHESGDKNSKLVI